MLQVCSIHEWEWWRGRRTEYVILGVVFTSGTVRNGGSIRPGIGTYRKMHRSYPHRRRCLRIKGVVTTTMWEYRSGRRMFGLWSWFRSCRSIFEQSDHQVYVTGEYGTRGLATYFHVYPTRGESRTKFIWYAMFLVRIGIGGLSWTKNGIREKSEKVSCRH